MTHFDAMAQTARAIADADVVDSPPEPHHWPKVCRCCGLHLSEAMWASLTKRGYIGAVRAGKRVWALELRDCLCRSTIGVEVELDVMAPAKSAASEACDVESCSCGAPRRPKLQDADWHLEPDEVEL